MLKKAELNIWYNQVQKGTQKGSLSQDSIFFTVTSHWFNILRQVNEIDTSCYFCYSAVAVESWCQASDILQVGFRSRVSKKSQSMIEPAVQFHRKKSCGHTHTHTYTKSLTGCCMGRVFEKPHAGWFSHPSYTHKQHCLISDEGIGILFQKGSPSFPIYYLLSAAVHLKIMVIAHRFHKIESISMLMIPSYMMRLRLG